MLCVCQQTCLLVHHNSIAVNPPGAEQQRTSRAVEQQVYRGALKSALNRADGKPILPHCQDTRGKVAALFPDAPNPVPLDTADCPHLTFTAGFVRNVVRKLDPAKAGGPSGMSAACQSRCQPQRRGS